MWLTGRGLTATGVLFLLAGCGESAGHPAANASLKSSVWTSRGAELTAQIPRGWHVSNQPLTSVSSPEQRLVVTSFVVRQRRADAGCGPSTALWQMPATGAMVFMFEYRGPSRHDVAREPARPRHFRLDQRSLATYECFGRSYLVRFTDHGRVLQAHIYLGRRASAQTRRRVLGVLDSLRVARSSARAEAVWVPPGRVLARPPSPGVACPQANRFACDRVGLAVWLRAPAIRVWATIDGRPFALDDAGWSGPAKDGRRRMFAGFLRPAGLFRGPLAVHADDGPGRWVGRRPVRAAVGLTIEDGAQHYVRTSLRVGLAPGWG